MSRIIVIADADYQITFENSSPVSATPGGTLLNVAMELSLRGHNVAMASEVGNDIIGDIIVDRLDECGVDTRSIDRSVDCTTPATLIFSGTETAAMRYTACDPDTEGFDIRWPDIGPGDIVLFGGYLAVSQRSRTHLMQLLSYAAERKTTIVYFPGFDPTRISRITKVMPLIFENLEIAQHVITRTADIRLIFDKTDPEETFKSHLDFYVDDYINIESEGNARRFTIGHPPVEFTIKPAADAAMIADAMERIVS